MKRIKDKTVALQASNSNTQSNTGANTGANTRAADQIVATIEQKILDGVLVSGTTLSTERELMNDFSASRSVVREAIVSLANRGLIETRPRFRPTVRKPSYDTAIDSIGSIINLLLTEKNGIKNLYDSRVFVERLLVRDAALYANKDHIVALRDALRANELAISDSRDFFRTDIAFHQVLYQIPKNPIFPAIHNAYTNWLAPHWEVMERSVERNQLNFKSHKAIFDAILERNPDTAEEALKTHLQFAWELVSVTFEEEES